MAEIPTTAPPGYALFKDGRRVSKIHTVRSVAVMEAFDRRVVVLSSQDFFDDPVTGYGLTDGYEIKEVACGQ